MHIYIYKEAFNSLLIHFAAILSTLKHPRNKYNRRLTVRPKGSPTFLEGDPSHPATPGVSGIPRLLHIWRATPPNHWWTQFPDNSRQEKTKNERSFSSLHGFHWSPSTSPCSSDRRLKCWKGWAQKKVPVHRQVRLQFRILWG